MKGPLLMVERDPVALPWPRRDGVLTEEKVELSGDDEVVAVRECNEDIESGIVFSFCEGLLLRKGRASDGLSRTKDQIRRLRFLLRKPTKRQERLPRRNGHEHEQ
jgi:hypothetical protein